jgi:Icc-related predicted phosphoesterase
MPRLVCISDTHTLHAKTTQAIIEARADILVHAGDITGGMTHRQNSQIGDFADWCASLLAKGYVSHVVAIAGNHDEVLDSSCPVTRRDYPDSPRELTDRLRRAGIIYLQDRAATVAGLKFYGAPWSHRYGDHGFMIDSAAQDEDIFSRVPAGLDVLITHCPPHGILDDMPREDGRIELTGSPALRRTIAKRRPRVHVFGHIHPHHGMKVTAEGVLCVNACTCNGDNRAKNRPLVLDLEPSA